ncbi:MAG: ABC transporter substrate-binding protein [Methylorubrum populi]
MVNLAPTRRTVLGGLALAALPPCAPSQGAEAASRRIVTLDGLFTETLLAIGRVPVATANRPLYEKLTAVPALPAEVVDLGPLQEPNLELLQMLRPDLIVAATLQAQTQTALARIAPVIPFPTLAGAVPPLDHLRRMTLDLGRLAGREAAADALVSRTDLTLEAAHGRLAGRTARPVYIARLREDGRQVAMFGGKSTVGAVAARLGLANAWAGRQSGAGTAVAGIEDLAGTPDALFVHFDRGSETARALERLNGSPIWQALPFVRENRILALPVVHPNGGLPSAARFAGQLAARLPAEPA